LSRGVTATANFHGKTGGDYLIQALRVNANNGSFGYCSNFYGGVFWGRDFGVFHSPTNPSDWASGSYKGECDFGSPLVGISSFVGAQAHAALCGSGPNSSKFPQNTGCYARSFGVGNGGNSNGDTADGSWDPGNFYIGQCAANEFVAGVAQSTSGVVDALLCCPGSVTHKSCTTQVFANQNSSGFSGIDWDDGYDKGQCPSGQYVAGVSEYSTTTSSGFPHALRCCTP